MTRRLPVRWRLTLWFSALLAITLVLLAGIVFFVPRSRLYAEFDDQLLDQATLTQSSIDVQNGVPIFNDTVDHTGDSFRRLFDARGQIRGDNSDEFGGVPLDQTVVAAALAGKTEYSTLTSLGPPPDLPDQTDPDDERNPPVRSCGSSQSQSVAARAMRLLVRCKLVQIATTSMDHLPNCWRF